MLHLGLTPPPIVTKNIMYFFSETRPLLGHFLKKNVFFAPIKCQTLVNIFEIQKLVKK